MIINNEAVIASNLQDYNKAYELFQEGLRFAKDNDLDAGLRTIQNAYLSHLMGIEAYDTAFELIDQAAHLTNKMDSAYYLLKRGKIQLGRGAVNDAVNDLRSGYALARQSGNNTLVMRYAELLYRYELEHDNAEAALSLREVMDTLRLVEKAEEAKKLVLLQEVKEEYQAFYKQSLQQRTTAQIVRFAILLALVLALLGYVLYRQRKRSRHREAQLMALKERLERERDVLMQQNELTSTQTRATINLMAKRNEVLSKTLKQIKHVGNADDAKTLSDKLDKTSILSEFEMQMTLVDPDFFDKLYVKFPNITKNERLLCAFLRLGMSTKDIVSITGKSLRAVEMARIRLRKKLQLDTSENLNAFLSQL